MKTSRDPWELLPDAWRTNNRENFCVTWWSSILRIGMRCRSINAFGTAGGWLPKLEYVASWVDEKLERCFQLMETDDRKRLDEWIARWSDIVDFEVYPVISSEEAAKRVWASDK